MNCYGKIKRIETFIRSHESEDITAEELEKLKGLNKALSEQVHRMEIGWDNVTHYVEHSNNSMPGPDNIPYAAWRYSGCLAMQVL